MSAVGEGQEPLVDESARVGVNAGLLVASRLAGMLLALVQSGIVFRALSLEGQGQFGAALGFASAFTVPATLGIQRLLVRDIARDYRVGWDYVWTAVVATGTLSTACLLLIWLLQSGSGMQSAAFWAGFSVVFLWALQQPFESLLVARERLGLIATMNLISGAAKLFAVFLLLDLPVPLADGDGTLVYTASAARAHAVLALANVLGLVLCFGLAVYVGGWQRPHLRPRAALAQVRECLPFAAAMTFSWVYFKSDIVLLEYFRGEREAGIYAPPQRLMEPLLMLASLWGTAVFPALCRLSHTDEVRFAHLKATSVRLALLLACPMAVGIAVLARPIMLLLTGDDAGLDESTFVLQLLAVVVPFFYLNGIGQEFLYAAHRNRFVVGALAVAAAVSLALNLILIPRFGVPGLCATAIAANAAVSVCYVFGLRDDLAAARLASLVTRSVVASALMGAVAWYLSRWNLALAVGGGVAACFALHGILGTLNAAERDLLRHAVAALGGKLGRWRK